MRYSRREFIYQRLKFVVLLPPPEFLVQRREKEVIPIVRQRVVVILVGRLPLPGPQRPAQSVVRGLQMFQRLFFLADGRIRLYERCRVNERCVGAVVVERGKLGLDNVDNLFMKPLLTIVVTEIKYLTTQVRSVGGIGGEGFAEIHHVPCSPVVHLKRTKANL